MGMTCPERGFFYHGGHVGHDGCQETSENCLRAVGRRKLLYFYDRKQILACIKDTKGL